LPLLNRIIRVDDDLTILHSSTVRHPSKHRRSPNDIDAWIFLVIQWRLEEVVVRLFGQTDLANDVLVAARWASEPWLDPRAEQGSRAVHVARRELRSWYGEVILGEKPDECLALLKAVRAQVTKAWELHDGALAEFQSGERRTRPRGPNQDMIARKVGYTRETLSRKLSECFGGEIWDEVKQRPSAASES
jgi:hypothetical protein